MNFGLFPHAAQPQTPASLYQNIVLFHETLLLPPGLSLRCNLNEPSGESSWFVLDHVNRTGQDLFSYIEQQQRVHGEIVKSVLTRKSTLEAFGIGQAVAGPLRGQEPAPTVPVSQPLPSPLRMATFAVDELAPREYHGSDVSSDEPIEVDERKNVIPSGVRSVEVSSSRTASTRIPETSRQQQRNSSSVSGARQQQHSDRYHHHDYYPHRRSNNNNNSKRGGEERYSSRSDSSSSSSQSSKRRSDSPRRSSKPLPPPPAPLSTAVVHRSDLRPRNHIASLEKSKNKGAPHQPLLSSVIVQRKRERDTIAGSPVSYSSGPTATAPCKETTEKNPPSTVKPNADHDEDPSVERRRREWETMDAMRQQYFERQKKNSQWDAKVDFTAELSDEDLNI